MKSYPTEQIRNVGLFGHQGAGKTSLAEAALYVSGAIDRLGRVEEGHTTTDFDPDEIKRQMTVFSALAPIEWKAGKINVLDTPGFFDFLAESIGALRATEGAILVAAANSAMEVGLEKTWDLTEDRSMPRILFVNKMDKENADFFRLMDECAEKLHGARVVPVQIPIGTAETFQGIVDLVAQKAYTFDAKGHPQETAIPADLQDSLATWREKLTEEAAEADDALTEKYLETMELSDEEIRDGLVRRIKAGSIVPALCGSSTGLKGIPLLLDAITEFIPAPTAEVVGTNPDGQEIRRPADSKAPLAALIFKTSSDPYVGKISYMRVYTGTLRPDTVLHNPSRGEDEKLGPIFTMRGKHQDKVDQAQSGDIVAVGRLGGSATGDTLCDPANKMQLPPLELPESFFTRCIRAKSKADEDKLSANLQRLMQEDPTLKVKRLDETRETILSGVGDVQLDLCVERLKRMGVDVELSTPKVPYRETLRGKVQQVARHKKQSGGRGQFAEVHVELSGLPRGEGFVFEDGIVGGVVSKNFIPAVEKGARKAMEEGILAGYQVVDVKMRLYDGKMHDVDSSDMAFQIAGSMAFKEGAVKAGPVLLEPIYEVEVLVPESFMGDVIGDLNSKRGRILGMEPTGRNLQLIKSQVPQAEMLRYAIDLRSITQGRGQFSLKFSHYEEAPPQVGEQVIAEARAAAAN